MDRTKAAEILHKARVCYATEYLDCHMVCDMCKYHVEDSLVVEAIDTAIKALDKDIDAPSKWIPCSERLPEHGGHYLVTEKISEECWFVGLAPYRSTCERWFGDHEVTAWMPLPEPYRGGEKE